MSDFHHKASDAPPADFGGTSTPVPVGNHVCALTKYERKDIKNGGGWGFSLEFTIVSGPHKGRRAWPFLSYGHVKENVAKIARDDVDRMCHALGIKELSDMSQMVDKPMIAYWGQEPEVLETDEEGRTVKDADGNAVVKYKAKNTVRGFKKLDVALADITPAPAPATTASGAPVPSWVTKQNAA